VNRHIHTYLGCEREYGDARIVVFGAPFDGTASFRPGARFAGAAMRGDSYGLETYSPYQDRDLSEITVFDGGDLELSIGNTERVLDQIESYTAGALADHKIPCMIGGEHLVSLGAVRAIAKRYPDLHVLHFDAHADLRDTYLGERLSHATVMRRVWELVGDGRLHQYGVRSGTREEFAWAGEHVHMRRYDFTGLADTITLLKGKPVYVSVDLDVLDPSVFPGTGTPEPGGVSFSQLLDAVLALKGLDIVGADLTELSPAYDPSGVSTVTACKVLRELLLVIGG